MWVVVGISGCIASEIFALQAASFGDVHYIHKMCVPVCIDLHVLLLGK